ncbi:MAG: DUF3267 domain-containing protein [Coriobacteriia bacterium]|nr:DUF3267 domain-containing protein [Coriobacteriia bacterium]
MKFQLGPVPLDEAFDPGAEGWNRLQEPRPGVLMVSAIPLGMVLALPLAWLWSLILPVPAAFSDGATFEFTISLLQIVGVLAILVGGILIHEMLHALPLAVAGHSENLVLGFWPRHFAPYVAYIGALPLKAQLLSGAMPLVALSVLPLVAALVVPSAAWWLALLSMVNVIGSGADLIMLLLLFRQVPRDAVIRNQGFSTWWRAV